MKMKLILLVTLVSLTLGAIPLPGQRSEAEMDLVLSRNENGPLEKRNKLLHPHILLNITITIRLQPYKPWRSSSGFDSGDRSDLVTGTFRIYQVRKLREDRKKIDEIFEIIPGLQSLLSQQQLLDRKSQLFSIFMVIILKKEIPPI